LLKFLEKPNSPPSLGHLYPFSAVGGEGVGEVAVEWGSRKGARVRPDEGDSEGLGFLSL